MANQPGSFARRMPPRQHLLALAASLTLAGCALDAPPDAKQLSESELAHATPPPTFKAGGVPAA